MNILGLVLSYVLVFVIIGLSTLLQKKGILGDEGARKFIHIGVSNWWLLAMFTFDDVWFAIIPPITFIILNYYSYKTNLIKSMERSGNGNLGTVYFPISLLILVVLTFGVTFNPLIGAIGILTLGYGDGLAAVIGSKWGKRKLIYGKSVEGSLTMLLATFIVTFTLLAFNFSFPIALSVALVLAISATVIELYTPKGLDNLTVPLLTSLIYYLILITIL
jgi:phytol kinase